MLLTSTLNCFSRTYLVCPSIQKKSRSMHAKNSKIQNQDVLFIFLAPISAILKSTIIFFMSLYNYTIIHTVFVYILCIKYFLYIDFCLPKQSIKLLLRPIPFTAWRISRRIFLRNSNYY